MIHLTDIGPLTGFLRDHKARVARLAATGRPEVLTVNGKARVVIQDAEAYQKLLAIVDAVETQQLLQERLAAIDQGKPGIPAAKVLADVRKRLGIAGR